MYLIGRLENGYTMDYSCDSPDPLAIGNNRRGRGQFNPYTAGPGHHCHTGQTHPGTSASIVVSEPDRFERDFISLSP